MSEPSGQTLKEAPLPDSPDSPPPDPTELGQLASDAGKHTVTAACLALMPRPHYRLLLDHQLLPRILCSVEQADVDKLDLPIAAPLPVEDVIVRNGIPFQVKVHLLVRNGEGDFLEIVLELKKNMNKR